MKKIAIALILVLILGAGAYAWYHFSRPSLDLKDALTIEAGDSFDPMDAIESVSHADISEVSVKSPDSIKDPGEYVYVFTLDEKEYEYKLTVKDTKAPEIKAKENLIFTDRDEIDPADLVDAADLFEISYTLDTKGQDLSVPGDYEVNVSAADTSGNTSVCSVSLHIEPDDLEAPVISGLSDLYVEVGSALDLYGGVTVTDNKDQNLGMAVTPSSIDTSYAGEYNVVYTAKDTYGNESSASRYVCVYTPAAPVFEGGWDRTGIPGCPYIAAVNRSQCCVTIYQTDENGNYTVPIKAMVCSVGLPNGTREYETETPTGLFYTSDRYDWCYMVDGSWGRYAIRVTWDGIMFHSVCYYSQSIDDLEYDEYNKLGSPASLGCIRLCVEDVKWLYDNMPYGFPVMIYDDPSSPGPLGKPSPTRIDTEDERRGWDPTDPSENNPWN